MKLLQFVIYPAMMLSGIGAAWLLHSRDVPHVLAFLIVLIPFIGIVRFLEWIIPFEPEWNRDKGDFFLDIKYNVINFGIISFTFIIFDFLRPLLSLNLWPNDLHAGLQILLAGLIVDLGMYMIHRLSHVSPLLWRFHSIHHSSERLYLLNGEKRHLFHAILEGIPGVSVLLLMGAPTTVLAFWFAILNLHLCFQHGNINYRTGMLRFIFSVAELHRWHHRKEYSKSQVNYGAFFSFWDIFLGTYLKNPPRYDANDIGLDEKNFPRTFFSQFKYPLRMKGYQKRGI